MNMGGALVLIPLILLGIATIVAVIWGVKRHMYRKSIEARGWALDRGPGPQIANGLNNPPFGVGVKRSVDDQISGRTASGIPFQSFRYRCSEFETLNVVTMPLPHSLPELYIATPDRVRPFVAIPQTTYGAYVATSEVPDFAQTVLGRVQGALGGLAAAQLPVDLSVDHAQLVAVGASRVADELAAQVEALAPIAAAFSDPVFAQWQGEPAPVEWGVYRRPGWVYRGRDDASLNLIGHTTGGHNHAAWDVVYDADRVLPFISMRHTWDTEHTETSTDSEGHTTTRTVTDHHSEDLLEFHPQFRFLPLKVNEGLFGERRQFESTDFNARFKIRCADAKFASDVFHPRMMEYFLKVDPPPFEIGPDNRIAFRASTDIASIVWLQQFLGAFFGRVPDFVWDNLGEPRPVPEVDETID